MFLCQSRVPQAYRNYSVFQSKHRYSTNASNQDVNLGAPSAPVKELRKFANKFLLKVHPDFFRNNEKISQTNEASLSQLNAFLDVVEQNSSLQKFRLIRNRVQERYSIKFWLKKGKSVLTSLTFEDNAFETIRGDFVFPPHFFAQDVSTRELEFQAIMFINQLLEKAGLPVMPVPDSVVQPGTKKAQAQNKSETVKRADNLRDELVKQLEPEFNVIMWKHKMVNDTTTVGDVLCNEDSIYMEEDQQIFYAPSLSMPQRASVWRDFQHSKQNLDHQLWQDLPIIFTNNNTYLPLAVMPGFVSIPFEFKLEELKTYLQKNLPEIRAQRRFIRDQIQALRFHQNQFTLHFGLIFVYYQCTRHQALETFASLSEVVSKMKKFPLEGMTMIISARHVTPEIDWNRDFFYIPVNIFPDFVVDYLEENLKKLRIRHASMAATEEHHTQVLTVCETLRKLLGAKKVMTGNSIAKSRLLQFTGLFNLRRNLATLTKLDLSQWTIVVGTNWKVDLKKYILYVTYDFDIDEFSRVITQKITTTAEALA